MNYCNEVKPSKSFNDFPYGWFRVAYSDELTFGKVIPLRYFERDLVLWRTQEGQPQIFDAYCPHLGAHLGYGGKVTATGIQCPFHGWCFDREGKCPKEVAEYMRASPWFGLASFMPEWVQPRRDRIPHSSKIPPQARINSWSVVETNGIILMYYHSNERSQHRLPNWTIPELPEYRDPDWIRVMRRRWRVRTNVYEVAENGIDTAHSVFVHAQTFAALKSNGLDTDGTTSIHRLSFLTKLLGREVEGFLTIASHGLGCQVSRTILKTFAELQFTAVFLLTPIDREYVEIDLVFTMKKLVNKQLTHLMIAPWLMRGIGKNLEQDIPIWENKIFQTHPLLCDGDGSISQYRRWARQFYS